MRVRDLGALVVAAGTEERAVPGARVAAMLAVLAINVNQRVSVDTLMTAVWGERIPAGASSTLASHVWRLRQLLEPVRARRTPPSVLVSDTDGYRLVGGPSTIDSLLFADGAAEVRDLLATGHAAEAVRRADAVLSLWRGQPYAGFAEAEWAVSAVARLAELRDQLRERRIEGLVRAGRLDTALSDLQPLVAELPFRERLRGLQMEALYRAGRGEAALHAYQDARRVLVEEIGIEPGPDLQTLHGRILRRDPTLDEPAARPESQSREVETHLPSPLTPLVGRADVLERVASLVRGHRLVTVTGAAGCGKTRVAIEAARRVAPDFPDGVWFVDLTAVGDADLVADVVVSTIGFVPSPGATPLQDLRRYLQSRRVLLVLDNCEHVLRAVEDVVLATLSGEARPECAFLATSREPVGVDGETTWRLDPLATSPAIELFVQRLAAVAPAMAVDDGVLTLAARISAAVDGLPLPIELAAARAESHSLVDIAAQAESDPGRLSRLGRRPKDHRSTVRSAIEWSYRLLEPDEQRAHRCLAVLPGAFTAAAAAAVLDAGSGGSSAPGHDDVDDLLARLVHRSLLTSERSAVAGRHTAFRQLSTIRSHARHALDESGEAEACLDRRDAWTAGLIEGRPPLGTAADARWHGAVDDDYAAVRATLARRLIEEPSQAGGRLAYPLSYYWFYRERLVEAERWVRLGHDVLTGSRSTDEFVSWVWLASMLTIRRRPDLAIPLVVDAAEQAARTPRAGLVDVGEALVPLAVSYYAAQDHRRLIETDLVLRSVADRAEDVNLDLLADAVSSCALLIGGRVDAAVELAHTVQRRSDAVDNPLAAYVSTGPLIVSAQLTGRPADGIRWVERCLDMHLRFGAGGTGMFAETRANFTAQLGRYDEAARSYASSRTATRRAAMVWPHREATHALLATTREKLGREAFEREWREGEQLTPAELFRTLAASAD